MLRGRSRPGYAKRLLGWDRVGGLLRFRQWVFSGDLAVTVLRPDRSLPVYDTVQ